MVDLSKAGEESATWPIELGKKSKIRLEKDSRFSTVKPVRAESAGPGAGGYRGAGEDTRGAAAVGVSGLEHVEPSTPPSPEARPPWQASPDAAGRLQALSDAPPPTVRSKRLWAALAALAVTIGSVAGLFAFGRRPADLGLSQQVVTVTVAAPPGAVVPRATAPSPVSTPTPTPPVSSTVDVNAASYSVLMSHLSSDQSAVASRMDGRLVVRLASKTAGVVDPLQTAANGTHTFGWPDVLAEHESYRNDPRFGASVLLLPSTMVGSRRVDPASGRPYLITIVDIGFANRDQVLSWCRAMFPNLTDAERNNTCMPMSMKVT